jgi:hypothetical protein
MCYAMKQCGMFEALVISFQLLCGLCQICHHVDCLVGLCEVMTYMCDVRLILLKPYLFLVGLNDSLFNYCQ